VSAGSHEDKSDATNETRFRVHTGGELKIFRQKISHFLCKISGSYSRAGGAFGLLEYDNFPRGRSSFVGIQIRIPEYYSGFLRNVEFNVSLYYAQENI